MLSSFVLALREGVEAALVVGILLSVLRKLNRKEFTSSIWWGVAAAFAVSVLTALGLNLAGESLHDPAEAIFEGITMIAAAGLLTWMIFWMHHQSRLLRGRIEADVRQALGQTGQRALFGVAFLAVVREGIELALYLVAAGLASNPTQELLGATLGLAAALVLGWMLFSSTRRLPLGKFFQVTNVLLVLFAAGLIAQAVHEFVDLGWIPAMVTHLYNLTPVLSEVSIPGQILKTLLGYDPMPSLTETLAYLIYFGILAVSVLRIPRQPEVNPA